MIYSTSITKTITIPKEHTKYVRSWIVQRVMNQNKNCIIVITGGTGSGKTYAAIDLAQTIAKETGANFDPKTNIAFKFSQLIKQTFLEQNTKRGTPFIFEEVGAMGGGANARQWQSKSNVGFSSFMQTARFLNQVLILTTPVFNFLDSHGRKLVHLHISMKNINPQSKQSMAKPYIIQSSDRDGKDYFKFIRVKVPGLPNKIKCKEVRFNLPDQQTLDIYEIMKKKYTDELYKEIMNQNEPKEKKVSEKQLMSYGFAKDIESNKYSEAELSIKWNRTTRTIRRWKKDLKNKEIAKQTPFLDGRSQIQPLFNLT